MSPVELLSFLQDFYRETFDLFNARQIVARSVAGYDANNAYQQVIGRQEVHLRWLEDAIAGLGGTPQEPAGARDEPAKGGGDAKSLIDADARSQQSFVDRWTPRVAPVTNARDGKMLSLILGEMREHLRLLEQAAEGRSDVLGRHADGKVLRGSVMAARPKN